MVSRAGVAYGQMSRTSPCCVLLFPLSIPSQPQVGSPGDKGQTSVQGLYYRWPPPASFLPQEHKRSGEDKPGCKAGLHLCFHLPAYLQQNALLRACLGVRAEQGLSGGGEKWKKVVALAEVPRGAATADVKVAQGKKSIYLLTQGNLIIAYFLNSRSTHTLLCQLYKLSSKQRAVALGLPAQVWDCLKEAFLCASDLEYQISARVFV